MNNTGRKVQLTISEPWDMSDRFNVVVRGQTMLGDLLVLVVSKDDELLVLMPRYKGEKIDDIWLGKDVIVNIAKVKSLTGGDVSKIDISWLTFFAVGNVKLLE